MRTGCFVSAILVAASLSLAVAAEKPIRIGVGAPLHGADAIFGDQLKQGVDQAIADINASGGFLGRKARSVAGDDGSEAKIAVDVAKGFVKSGVRFVIGHFSSATTVPASVVYDEAGALEITPSAIGPIVTDRGLKLIFRTCGREDQQAEAAAAFIERRHYARVAILHDRTPTGKALADSVRSALGAHGATEAYYGSFAEGSRDISGLLSRLRASGAQIVFWGGGPTGAALVVRGLRDSAPHIPLLGGLAMTADAFAAQAGTAADGTFSIFPRDPRRQPAAADLLRKLQAKDIDPGAYVFYAYAAVQVLQQAAAKAQSLEPSAMAKEMHGVATFDTVVGPIAFDVKGDPKATDLTVYVWHKGPTGRMGFWDEAAS